MVSLSKDVGPGSGSSTDCSNVGYILSYPGGDVVEVSLIWEFWLVQALNLISLRFWHAIASLESVRR